MSASDLHYLGKSKLSKICVNMNDKTSINSISLGLHVVHNSQSITRFNCRSAVCLVDGIHECLWIQEVTGKVWSCLEQNIVDTAVNEWRKHLGASVRTMGKHNEQCYCRLLKNGQLDKTVRNVNKICLWALIWLGLSNHTALDKM